MKKTGRHRNVEMFRKAKAFSKSRIDKCCESLERKCPFEVVFKVIKRARWLQRQSVQRAFDVTARQPSPVEEAFRLCREYGLVSARANKTVEVTTKTITMAWRAARDICACTAHQFYERDRRVFQAHGFAFHTKCYFCSICFVELLCAVSPCAMNNIHLLRLTSDH